jgi:hypothetical protein
MISTRVYKNPQYADLQTLSYSLPNPQQKTLQERIEVIGMDSQGSFCLRGRVSSLDERLIASVPSLTESEPFLVLEEEDVTITDGKGDLRTLVVAKTLKEPIYHIIHQLAIDKITIFEEVIHDDRVGNLVRGDSFEALQNRINNYLGRLLQENTVIITKASVPDSFFGRGENLIGRQIVDVSRDMGSPWVYVKALDPASPIKHYCLPDIHSIAIAPKPPVRLTEVEDTRLQKAWETDQTIREISATFREIEPSTNRSVIVQPSQDQIKALIGQPRVEFTLYRGNEGRVEEFLGRVMQVDKGDVFILRTTQDGGSELICCNLSEIGVCCIEQSKVPQPISLPAPKITPIDIVGLLIRESPENEFDRVAQEELIYKATTSLADHRDNLEAEKSFSGSSLV